MTDFGRRAAVAAANVLPKTGQTTSYRDGDDGYYQKGWTDTERFTDNGDGTVTDNATGLMWPKDWGGAATNNGEYLSWQGAIDFAETLDLAEHQDWRLPNVSELASIINYERTDPATYEIFDNIPRGRAWSSSTYSWASGYALFIDLYRGNGGDYLKTEVRGVVLPARTA